LAVTLLDTRSATARIRYPAGDDPLVETADWVQTGDGVRFVLHLAAPPFGYRVLGAPGALVVRVRRPPAVSRRRPLRGLTIAVDPGHPPAGAVGPTGLPESEATLAVARRLARLLEARGARVVLTRSDAGAVGLDERPARALAADAHALVSLHADALPPGVDLARGRGTSTHFFHPHSAALARAVQRGMLARMGLEDRGVSRSSLALVRTPWMPAVLCEGATLVDPVHEAALRTPAFQEAYARGVADGLEAFFRGLAAPGAARP
ncbi:MAG TPA: N-acetylmuramoyl-L-alanine amidase, partial [Longimicrobium sp.]|nr:N-acetylmuramoyl-L-alanine amidase [Longimicrobium sp.]